MYLYAYAFQYLFSPPPLFSCVLTQKESQPLWNSLQGGLGLFQVGCSSRGSCSLQQLSWQATFAVQTSYQPSYAGGRPGKVLLDSSVGSAGATGEINELWVIDWFGQVGKLKLEKLPGVFCLKAFSGAVGKGAVLRSRLACNCPLPR